MDRMIKGVQAVFGKQEDRRRKEEKSNAIALWRIRSARYILLDTGSGSSRGRRNTVHQSGESTRSILQAENEYSKIYFIKK